MAFLEGHGKSSTSRFTSQTKGGPKSTLMWTSDSVTYLLEFWGTALEEQIQQRPPEGCNDLYVRGRVVGVDVKRTLVRAKVEYYHRQGDMGVPEEEEVDFDF